MDGGALGGLLIEEVGQSSADWYGEAEEVALEPCWDLATKTFWEMPIALACNVHGAIGCKLLLCSSGMQHPVGLGFQAGPPVA